MADITIHRVEPSDLLHVGANMRQCDVDEVMACIGESPVSGLTTSYVNSPRTAAARIDGEAIAVYGIATPYPEPGVACPWLLGTDGVTKHAAAFTRRSRPEFDRMKTGYNKLINYVDMRNEVSVRWLKWLGFTLEEPKPYGFEGRLFHKFYMEVS